MIPAAERHAHAVRRGVFLLFSLALALGFVGCELRARHRILTFFFDAVPPLEEPKPEEAVPPQEQSVARPPQVDSRQLEAPQPVVFMHTPFREKKCGSCHDLTHGNRVDHTSALCFRCHQDDKTTGKVVHAPVAGGECITCHDPHQSAFRYQLNSAPPTLCLDCHDKAALAQTTPHTLAGDRVCTACHTPHSSDTPGLLLSLPGGRVCFYCHEPSEVIAPDKLTHKPAMQGACFRCHVSHTRGGESHLAREGKALCGECHQVPAGDATRVHAPVAEGDCLVCHNPHGSAIPPNLQKELPTLCWQCHDQTLMAGAVKHAAAEEGGCPECHSPHGSQETGFLVESVPGLCAACHEGDSDHVEETLADNAICTECHSPHSAMQAKLLR